MDEQIKKINLIMSILEEEQQRLRLMYPEGSEGTIKLRILSLINKLKTILFRLSKNDITLSQAEKLTNNIVVDTNKICDGCILDNTVHIID